MRVRGLLALIALVGCDADTTITKRNDAPSAAIDDPAHGATVREGDTVTFRGVVTDTDDATSDLLAAWFSGAEVLCEAAPVAEDGTTLCEAVVGLEDADILLEGRDPDNATGIASIALDIVATGVPSVDILTPDGAGPYYADHPVAFTAVVGDYEDEPTALSVVWTDEAGTAVDVDATADADGALAGSYGFAEGPHAVTLSVTDTSGKTASTTVAFGVGGPNVPPDCTITGPTDGYVTGEGIEVAFTGVVTDPDIAEELLTASWSSDIDGALATGAADVDGNVASTAPGLSHGEHTITLTGADEVGATCVDTLVVNVGAAPSVDIDLPGEGDVYNEGDTTSFSATVSDDGTASDALILTWESDLDGVLDTTPADSSGLAAFDAGWLSVGAHTVTLTAIDELGLASSASVSFVVNGLPTAPTVTIDPASPSGGDDLVATVSVDATDPESDPITYSYAWYVDGVATAYTTSTLPADATTRGERWDVYVTPNDGYGDGPSGTATVTIGNTAPDLADVVLTPDPAREGDTLTCTPGASSDADGDAISLTYAWTVDGVVVAETGASLDASGWARGDVVVCTVTPTDGTAAGAPVASNPVTIGNSVPGLASVEISPEAPEASDTLTCAATGFSDADGDADLTVYEWTVNGVYAGAGTTLAGGFLGGDEVACAATPFDGLDYGVMLSESVTIDNTAPVLADVTLTPESPTEADLLVCTPGLTTDADGTTSFTYTYSWTVDGVAVAAAGSTLDSSAFAKGDAIACRVVPNDGTDDGAMVASNVVRAVNTAPEVTSVTLAPTSPATDDTITATVATADIDGDPVSVTYTWYVDGVAVAGTGATLAGASFDNGDTVHVVVTPNDGEEDGAPVASAPVVVANTLPVLTSVTLTPTPAYEATTLTCAAAATDLDGDTITYTYGWTVNGAAIAATGATLTGADFDRDDTVACTATPEDGSGSGAAGSSDPVVISNTAPVASGVTLSPTSATESSTLTCAPTATDADGDAIAYTYAWHVNGAAIAATSATLTGASFDGGDTVFCRATPTDGTTAGAAMASNTVTIGNTAPVLSSVVLTPTTATEASTLTCTPTATDADGDTVSYTYAWYVDSAAIAATSATLTGTYFDAGDTVYCRVTPNDGATSGTAMSSNVVTVENTAPVVSGVTLTPATAYEATTLTCTPSATDADGDTVTYTYAWHVNGAAIAPTSTTLTGTYFDRGDTVSCRVTPNDGTAAGAVVASNTVTIANTAPVASTVTLTPTSATESSTLTCAPSATDADGDAITYTYAWHVNGAAIAATSTTLTGASFDGGDTVYCRATPTDGTTAGAARSSNTVTISNTAPVLSSVVLTPTTATEASTLTCTPTATDADGDAVSYTYAWYVDSAAIAATSTTLTGTYFDAGDTVYCRVTPNDGATSGTAMSSNVVTVENTAPVVSGVTLTPATAYEATTLTCTPSATDADGDTVSYTYAWHVNGAVITPTSTTLTGTYFDRGDTVSCRVTPNDGTASGTAVASNTVTIANTAPVASTVTLTPTTATESSTVTCAPTATDADGDTITYTYAWHVNGAAIAATSTTLTGASFDGGDTVYCRATPTDGTTAGTAMSSNVVTVANTAPVLSGVVLTPTTATEASTFTCTPTATDADGDTISYTYAWHVNGAAISRTTSTLTGTYFDGGDTVYCRVTPTDGATAGTAMSSNVVTVANTAPVLSSVTLTPTTAYEATTLTCTSSATDADGDTISYTYAWHVNGAAIAATSSTLTGASFDGGDTVYCRATPTDGTTAGAAMSSNTVTVGNTAPVLASVVLTPTTAYEASTLTCTPTATDADGDAISYTYAWHVNGAAISRTTSTLTGTYFDGGDTVYCRVTPTDGATAGTAMSSNTVTIANTAPVLSSVTLTPTTAYETSTLTCTPGSTTDADGTTSFTYTYAWVVNGSTISRTTSTLTGTYFDKDDTVYCRATPTDGATAGTAMSSNVVTIANTAPILSSVTLTPTTAYETSTLTCTPGSTTDADGTTSFTYTYAWVVNGSTISRTTSTLTGTYFDKDDTVYCRATPSDGSSSGAAVASNTVTIRNTAPTAPSLAISPTAPVRGVDDLHCVVVTDAADADGDAVDYDITWTVDGGDYPGAFSGTTGPTTTDWLDDTIPAADTDLGDTWTCTAVPFDDDDDGASATASITVVGECAGVPVAAACSGETVRVAYLPGWGSTHTSSSSLVFGTIETNSLTYGDCTIDITSVGSGFTLATLSAYQAIIISDPSGGSRQYTAAEQTAIRDYLEGGYGGAVGSFLVSYLTYDNTALMDLFGIDASGITAGASAVGASGTVVDASHPVADGLPASFTLLGYAYEQANSGGWTSADLLECASFVVDSSAGSSIIANDDQNWRSVYFTGMPEYNNPGTSSQQSIYNALLWAAGYQ